MPALADELSPQLFRQVAQRERRRPGRKLEPAPLLGEVGRQLRLVVGERDLDGAALARLELLEKRRGRPGNDEEFLRRPLTAAVRNRDVHSALQGFERQGERTEIEGTRSARADAVCHVPKALENCQFLGLLIGQHRQHALDVRNGGQALERDLPGLELRDRGRRRERCEH